MPKKKKYSGVIVPMVTPVTEDGTIDQDAVTRITKHLITHNAAPFILGTTGESASIPEEYKADFVKNLVSSAAGQILTYAAVSGNCLKTSIEAAKRYFDLGIDVVVAHPPGFYPLTDSHLQKYYETLIENIPGHLIVYNIPLVTRISIPLDVVEKLSQHPRIVGLKDSEQDKARHDELDGQQFQPMVFCWVPMVWFPVQVIYSRNCMSNSIMLPGIMMKSLLTEYRVKQMRSRGYTKRIF